MSKNTEGPQEAADLQGALRAQKSPMKRSIDRAKVVGILGVVGLALTACGSADPQPSAAPDQSQIGTPEPTSPEPSASASPLEDTDPSDSFVPLEEVTDEYGTYIRLTVDPDSPLMELDESVVDTASLEASGFTLEDALEVQQQIVRYAVEEWLDSPRLDNYSQSHEEWLAAHEGMFTDLVNSQVPEKGPVLSGLVMSDYLPTPINRTGGPRGSLSVEVTDIQAYQTDAGDSYISVGLSYSNLYDTTDAVMREALARNTGQPAESFRDLAPALFDGDESATLAVSGTIHYGYDPETQKIAGATGDWYPSEAESGLDLESGQLLQD